jgi:hypothetical protein
MSRGGLLIWLCVVSAACSSSSNGVSQQLCALASACAESSTTSFGGQCEEITELAGLGGSESTSQVLVQSELGCLQSATDCASFRACITVSASAAAACTGSASICANGYSVACGSRLGGLTEGNDCQSAGLVCGQTSFGAECGIATCDSTTTKPKCDGTKVVTCSSFGVTTATDCSTEGATCAVVAGTAMCVGTGASCDETTSNQSCDGTTLVSCVGGKLGRFDCTSADSNLTCKVDNGQAKCAGVGTQCTDMTAETCSGGVITYCMFGTTTKVDCTSFGLSGCNVVSVPGQLAAAACTE